ncbi:MAG: DUF2459 domain-containing protein [Pseudomonadota bacterium]
MLWILLVICAACVGPIGKAGRGGGEEPAISVYLVNHGWHTGLVIPRPAVPTGLWPEVDDFPDADFLEVGWGDWDFYQSPETGVWMTLKAAFWPTASILHVMAIRGNVGRYYPHSEIIELTLSRESFWRLCRFIHDSNKRHGDRADPMLSDFYRTSRFYPAQGNFHLFRTCNAWTTSALRAAGYPIGSLAALFSSSLMSGARKYGRPIR